MKKKILVVVILLIVLLGFVGYRLYGDFTAVKACNVTLEHITIQDVDLTSCTLQITIRFSNPTAYDISGLSAVFVVYIANIYVGSGSFSKVSVPAHTVQQKDVPFTFFYTDAAGAVINSIQKRSFILLIQGTVNGHIFYGLITVSQEFTASYAYP